MVLVLMGVNPLQAHTFDVLDFRSPGRDAIEFSKSAKVRAEAYGILMDGAVTSLGTEATTYDRTLVSHLQVWGGWGAGSRFYVRPNISVNGNWRKIEGAEAPRTITESQWLEGQARLEGTFITQNSLEVFLGVSINWYSAYEQKTQSVETTTYDRFSAAKLNYPHLGVVKRSGGFEGGFYFISGNEKVREVTKSSEGDDSIFRYDDRVFQPTTIGIFSRFRPRWGSAYGEFAAVQASEGGNRTDDGGTVEEDYIRFTLGGEYELPGGVGTLLGTLIYKSLSYADNRNVSLPTIPMWGSHLGLRTEQLGFPVTAGLIAASGRDGQSIDEFNAEYRMQGLGLRLTAALQL
jgi:transcriptional regulator with XRE-family HTH domain